MRLVNFEMEDWFLKIKNAKYNLSESGIPNYNLKELLKLSNKNIKSFENIYLGNNDTRGSFDVRKSICSLYEFVNIENIIVGSGTSEILYILCTILLNKESKLLMLNPSFPMLYLLPKAIGSKVYFVNSLNKKNTQDIIDDFIQKIHEIKPDIVIINSPHNPTGLVFSVKDIKKIYRAIKIEKSKILFDEHYRYLKLNGGSFDSFFDVFKEEDVFAVGSLNKSLGIVGVRVGWLLSRNYTLLDKVRKYKDYTSHCVPLISEKITELAIKNKHKITSYYINIINENLEIIKSSKLYKKNIISLNHEVSGGCVCYLKINCMNYSKNTLKLAKKLYNIYDISIMPGEVFKNIGYIRVNLSININQMKYFLNSLSKLIKNDS